MRRSGRLIVLDRDGVINADSDEYIKSPEEWHPLPGSLEAIGRLARAGYKVVVATNQSGVGRGIFTAEALEAIHAKMRASIEAAGGELAGIYVCPHRPEDRCQCRKPLPGLLEQIAADFGQSLEGVPFIGDKRSDVEAARAAGAVPVFVTTGGEIPSDLVAEGVAVYGDLAQAVEAMLSD